MFIDASILPSSFHLCELLKRNSCLLLKQLIILLHLGTLSHRPAQSNSALTVNWWLIKKELEIGQPPYGVYFACSSVSVLASPNNDASTFLSIAFSTPSYVLLSFFYIFKCTYARSNTWSTRSWKMPVPY